MASVHEGTGVFTAVTGSNPGGIITANRNLTLGNLPVGTYLRQGRFPQPAACTSTGVPASRSHTDLSNIPQQWAAHR